MSGHGAEVEVPHDDNDPFVKKVAMSVAVFAVVLALAAAGGNNAGKDMLMNQMKASNEWARYQSKSQKQVLVEQEQEQLELKYGMLKDADAKGALEKYKAAQEARKQHKEPEAADEATRGRQRLAFVAAEAKRYDGEKQEIKKTAEDNQNERDLAHKRDPYFDTAELLLQIGIVLASVAMLSKARWAFIGGAVLGVLGLLLTINGYFLLVDIPFLGGGGHAAEAAAGGAGH